MTKLWSNVVRALEGKTLVTAESCTGGGIGSALTSVPGSSAVYKGGVICSEILLPDHVPREYADRETLWNAVEKVERGKNAQLAYSFDVALQNEFSMDENIALARQFLMEHFVSRGMIVDFAVDFVKKS